MTDYPLTVAEIVTWYRSKQRLLAGSDVSIVEIIERNEHLPAAAADLTGTDSMGRINGWASGEFDFEAVRVSDGEDIFWRHVKVATVEALEDVFADFLRSMRKDLEGDGEMSVEQQ
jgi:hypothetical protein